MSAVPHLFFFVVIFGVWLKNGILSSTCRGDPNIGFSVQITSDAGRLLKVVNSGLSASCQKVCCLVPDGDCTVAVWNQKRKSCSLYSCPTDLSCDLVERKGHVSFIFDSNYAIYGDYDGTRNLIHYKKGSEFPRDDDDDISEEIVDEDEEAENEDANIECNRNKDCITTLIDGKCHDGKCSCSFNWKKFGHICYAPCSDNEWECRNLPQTNVKSSKRHARCIAIYNKCDGIRNCADGSDEEDCETQESGSNDNGINTSVNITKNDSNETEISPENVSKFVDHLNDIINGIASNETKVAVTAVILSSGIATIAVLIVCCRFCRARRMSYRRRRLVENLKKHSEIGRRAPNKLFSANDDEGDSLISNDSSGNGMFLM